MYDGEHYTIRIERNLHVEASVPQFSIGLAVVRVTATGRFLQPSTIEDREVTAVIFDEPLPLQGGGGGRNAHPTHAEHERQELLGDSEVARMGSILRHQKPASEPRADLVKT